MPASILTTKLFIPQPRTTSVSRPRLIERLNAALRHRLIFISAPAGFGKTTLVSEWIGSCGHPAAWLSLDEGDSDLNRFLAYLTAALRPIAAKIGMAELPAAQPPQSEPAEAILTALINAVSTAQTHFLLVLDDYHTLDSKAVDDALTYLLEHMPPTMHVVITSREDPNLPLARLRVRDQLSELRVADLRFTRAEAASFLNQTMGLALSREEIELLEARTEGWVAGLQLAALSMQGQKDVFQFIQAFAGNHRYVMDYLVEEVLRRQPAPVRTFLLTTSILERLSGSLCDALTGQKDGGTRLEELQRRNYFVTPLDDQRMWYRYHHLFAEVLQAQLAAEQPGQVAELHRRASAWHEQNGLLAGAIQHALTAGDFSRAAELVERVFPDMGRSRQEATLLGWLRAIPAELIRERPVLCNWFAGALLQTGEIEGAEAWLRAAERWIEPAENIHAGSENDPSRMSVVEDIEFRRLPGAVALHRAGQALLQGNLTATLHHAQRALDLAPEDDYLRQGGAVVLQGLVLWTNGELETAKRKYAAGMAKIQRAGNLSDLMGCALAVADIQITQGRLRDSMRTFKWALHLAEQHGTPALRGSADMLVGMSELYREQDNIPAAVQLLVRSMAQGEQTGLPQNRYRWRVAMALIREAEGDLDGALALLEEADRVYMSDFSPEVRPIAALKARMWLRQGRLEDAFAWAEEKKISCEDNLSYLLEFAHITLSRIHLAGFRRDQDQQSIQSAQALLERLLAAAESGGRLRSTIEIRILQALVHQARANISAAVERLQPALALGEKEGFVRLFVDEGPALKQILLAAAARKSHPAYIERLLAAFEPRPHIPNEDALLPRQSPQNRTPAPPQAEKAEWIETLSQRELDVLRLFRSELSGPEIARELMVALSTVRTHTKSIYAKLNVNNRRLAVKRAIELKLI